MLLREQVFDKKEQGPRIVFRRGLPRMTKGESLIIMKSRFKISVTMLAAFLAAMCHPVQAVFISITNTSSSYYELRDETAGNTTVTNVTSREGVTTLDVPDNHGYRLHLGQIGDQGSHFFQVIGGQVVFPLANPPSAFFTNHGPTSLTIGSIPVHFRRLAGSYVGEGIHQPSVWGSNGGQYFGTQFLPYFGQGDATVNLVPTDGAGFVGNWKNTFLFGIGLQQSPFQLGPLGIRSMTGDFGSIGTIAPGSIVQTNFVEGGIGYNGFLFSLDRAPAVGPDWPGDGSQWIFFAAPEPGSVALVALGGAVLALFRRRHSANLR